MTLYESNRLFLMFRIGVSSFYYIVRNEFTTIKKNVNVNDWKLTYIYTPHLISPTPKQDTGEGSQLSFSKSCSVCLSVEDSGSPLDGGLSGYNTKSLYLDHSG